MRKLIIAANWKMNKGPQDTAAFINEFNGLLNGETDKVDIVIAPAFISLPKAQELLASSAVGLSSQNVSDQDSGAYTGEVSVSMLKEVGVEYVILGHSERRTLYGDTDAFINSKLKKTLEAGLIPIFCIGETLEQRESGQLETVLETQIKGGLVGIDAADLTDLVVAYEPVWAIGTGVTATSQQAQDTHVIVRRILADQVGQELADKVRIQYGGSVKPGNANELFSQPDIDGALVGGASLEAQSFCELAQIGAAL